jgi:carbamoyl-phosphate synthase large subunit
MTLLPKNSQEEELTNDYLVRRRTVDFGIPLITDVQLAQRFVEALARKSICDLQIKSWSEYRKNMRSATGPSE